MTDTPEAQVFAAVQADDGPGISLLIDQDARHLQARNEDGSTVLLAARYFGATQVIEALRPRVTALDVHEAAAYGEQAWLESHIRKDPSVVESRSGDGWTPLHLAALFAPAKIVQLLVGAKAPVNAVADNGVKSFPLHASAARGELDSARTLLEAGAEVDAKQEGGWTALHLACSQGNDAMVDLLLGYRADLLAVGDSKQTPADLAEAGGFPALAERLKVIATSANPGLQQP